MAFIIRDRYYGDIIFVKMVPGSFDNLRDVWILDFTPHSRKTLLDAAASRNTCFTWIGNHADTCHNTLYAVH